MLDLHGRWLAAMTNGDYAGAWQINDAVLAARDPAARDDPAVPYHRRFVWDGRPFRGRSVLVRCYHGLGDTLQYLRFLSPLRAQVASLTLEVQPELIPLLQGIRGPDRIVPFVLDAPTIPSECDFEIMELSHALRLPPTAVKPPYIAAKPVPLPPRAIGLCWRAGEWDSERSLPPSLLAQFADTHPVVSLVPGATGLPVINPQGSCDIATVAGMIAGLDLVITVDTMVAHLAGALGRRTWLLLKHDADWRWQHAGDTSVWYPATQFFCQARRGDWASVIERVRARLEPGNWQNDRSKSVAE